MLILDKTRINILVDVHFLIPTFQVVLIHINKVGNRINKVGHETTKWVNESTKWINESTSWTAPNQPRGSRQLYASDTKGINVKSTVDKKRISSSTQRRNARRREEFLKRSSTLSHLHHLNLKDNFSSDIANSFFMDVLLPFWRGRWLPPTQYSYYVKFGTKDSGQRLFRGGRVV